MGPFYGQFGSLTYDVYKPLTHRRHTQATDTFDMCSAFEGYVYNKLFLCGTVKLHAPPGVFFRRLPVLFVGHDRNSVLKH